MEKLTADQEAFLDTLLRAHPGACAYGPEHDPRVHEIAAPLAKAGWVDRYEDEFTDDKAVTQALGDGTVAYRLSAAMVERFKRTAAEKAESADLN